MIYFHPGHPVTEAIPVPMIIVKDINRFHHKSMYLIPGHEFFAVFNFVTTHEYLLSYDIQRRYHEVIGLTTHRFSPTF
jgi:hypothetical protein